MWLGYGWRFWRKQRSLVQRVAAGHLRGSVGWSLLTRKSLILLVVDLVSSYNNVPPGRLTDKGQLAPQQLF